MKVRCLFFGMTAFAVSCVADGWRFTIPGDLIDPEASTASPGSLPPTLSTNGNVEIIDWGTSTTPTPERGQFLLKLRQPARAGTILYYGAGELTYGLSNDWKQVIVPPGRQNSLALVPFGSSADMVRIFSEPVRQPDQSGYRATVPFLTLLPVPATNVAARARISASSGRTELLIDGSLETNTLFHAAPVKGTNAWIVFRWPEPEAIRGVGLFGGPNFSPLTEVQIQYAIQKGEKEQWLNVHGRPTQAGQFRSNYFFIASQRLNTSALRLSERNPEKDLAFSEVIVLQDMRSPPAGEKQADKPKQP